ncbi:deoxyribose-phosphate aldolase [Prochlorococcus sp. MIT 1300]|uniref:deoxyribose-phosphate aldolase n=1 Tax=Prochlorococcus sp. MIT 1300 TaxID=3096218 RepID=UPI002A7477AA|nr:deoxyribose-phosphate aldolase [Prochlorococcus sp. MIT 1300]
MLEANSGGNYKELAPFIKQAMLDPHQDKEEIKGFIDSACHFGFSGICTSLNQLPHARKQLGTTGKTKLIAVIAFPFGAIPTEMKLAEVEWAAEHGAEELDIVPNFYELSLNQSMFFAEEIASLCEPGLPVNIVLNMNKLSSEELSLAVNSSIEAGAQGLQTSNGFGPAVTPGDIHQLVEITKGRCSIKAAGGIHKLGQVVELIEAGANHIGTSKGAEIMQELRLASS